MFDRPEFDNVFYALKDSDDLKSVYKSITVKADCQGNTVSLVKDERVFIDSFEQSLTAFIKFYKNKPPQKMIDKHYLRFLTKTIVEVINFGVYSKPLSGRDILLFFMYHERPDSERNDLKKVNEILSYADFFKLYTNKFDKVFDESEFRNESLGSRINLFLGILESFYNNKLIELGIDLDKTDKSKLPDVKAYLKDIREFIIKIS